MAVRPVTTIGDPVLRVECAPVPAATISSSTVQETIDDMIDTMRQAGGAGIAANQIGVSMRILAIEVDDNRRYPYKPSIPLTVVINPVMEILDDESWANNEGCLSVPLRGDLERPMRVRLTGLDRQGARVDMRFAGLSAGTVQHEMDHLVGRLIVDRIDSRTLATWDHFRAYRQDDYLRSIQHVIEITEPKGNSR